MAPTVLASCRMLKKGDESCILSLRKVRISIDLLFSIRSRVREGVFIVIVPGVLSFVVPNIFKCNYNKVTCHYFMTWVSGCV